MDTNHINSINWFPGHMQKATKSIKEKIKFIDIIVQIVDARAINITSNDDFLKEVAGNKTILKIALKKDMSNISKNEEILVGSIYDNQFREKFLKKINELAKPKILKLKKAGNVNPKIYLIVLGLPNVGKSSFINFISKKNNLISHDKPGVTKKNIWININKNIEMLDTPGILFKKIHNIEHGYILALLRCIKWDILPKYDVIKFGYNFLLENYKNDFMIFFNTKIINDFDAFIIEQCKMKKFLTHGSEYDIDKFLEKIYKDISTGKICKINYER